MNRLKDFKNWLVNMLSAVPEFFFSDRVSAYAIRWVVSLTLLIGIITVAFAQMTSVEWLKKSPMLVVEYLIVLFLAFLFSLVTAARYLKDLYELDKVMDGFTYLMYSILFFFMWPSNTASEGQLKKNKVDGKYTSNLIHVMGGPGTIKVTPRNLVIFEKLEGPSQVFGEGKHNITRYQFVKMVLSLDDQYVDTGNIVAITLDGIRVEIPNIAVRYKLREREPDWIRDRGNTTDGDSYIEAARKFATNSLVAKEASMSLSMSEMVKEIIRKAAKKYLNRHLIDQIIVPDDNLVSSRQAMKAVLQGIEVRNQMKEIGARLLGVEIDTLTFEDFRVEDTRLAKWRETKRGERMVMQAKSEAYELSRQDAVRSRTQVEMTSRIIEALDDLNLENENDLDTLISLRTAQILDAWSGLYSQKDGSGDRKDKPDEDGKKSGDKPKKNNNKGSEK